MPSVSGARGSGYKGVLTIHSFLIKPMVSYICNAVKVSSKIKSLERVLELWVLKPPEYFAHFCDVGHMLPLIVEDIKNLLHTI